MVSNGINRATVWSCFVSVLELSYLFSHIRWLDENEFTGSLPPEWSSLTFVETLYVDSDLLEVSG